MALCSPDGVEAKSGWQQHYLSAKRWPSNTVGWQVRPAAVSDAHRRAAAPALFNGPTTRRSSSTPGFDPSRTAATGRRPSSSAGWLLRTDVHNARRPSNVASPPRSTANSVLVATEPAACSLPVKPPFAADCGGVAGAWVAGDAPAVGAWGAEVAGGAAAMEPGAAGRVGGAPWGMSDQPGGSAGAGPAAGGVGFSRAAPPSRGALSRGIEPVTSMLR